MNPLPDVCTYTDFRDNMAAHFDRLKKAKRPTVITRNGKAAAVVLSIDAYEALVFGLSLDESRAKLARSIEQARRGETISIDEVERRIREKHGLPARTARKRRNAA